MPFRTVVLALAVLIGGLCASSTVHASPKGADAVVAPAHGAGMTGGQLLEEAWARSNYTNAPNPLNGSCESLARDVLVAHFDDDLSARCQATQRTRLFLYFGTACFNVEEGVGETEEAQLACAVGSDRSIHELNVTVDGETTALVNPRFEIFSRQRSLQLPEDNVFGESEVSFTAHGWGAVVRRLRPGVHTVTMELVAPDWGEPTTFTVVVDVLRSGVR
ncbi:MAG TPA: hypothetical protein VFN43_07080 [Humibacillus sp.]|nr:hypothetical protein [Humibacillus sp.]